MRNEDHAAPTDASRSSLIGATSSSEAAARFGGDTAGWALAETTANDGLWYWVPSADELHITPRAAELFGVEATTTHGAAASYAGLAESIDPADYERLRAAMADVAEGTTAQAEVEFRVQRDRTSRWLLLRVRAARRPHQPTLVGGTVCDIHRRKLLELRLREEPRRDGLTGLANRAALSDRLAARICRATDAQADFAVVYVDLDRFKIVNDSLGHAAGDDLLVDVASRITTVLGPEDFLARVGGDEFVVLLDEVPGVEYVCNVAKRLLEAMQPAFKVGGREAFTSASIGIRLGSPDATKPGRLIGDADVAMYEAKRHGGDRAVVYDRAMHERAVDRLRIQTDLHYALRRDELELAYQPIFDADDMRLCGFEALARWNHPTRGRLSAGQFVADANASGAIVPIGRWVIGEAVRQLAEWFAAYPRSAPLSVSVNVCDRELLDPDFCDTVFSSLEAVSLPASRLVIEMSEGVLSGQGDAVLNSLRRLRAAGVQIQLDNFGVGASSLSILRTMPLTAIKIDRSFVREIAEDGEARAFVATIAGFARALGLDVVAEGVERRQQAAVQSELRGIRFVQGNYFGEPRAASAQCELLGSGG